MVRLNESEIVYASKHTLDDQGRVFFWQGRIYRAISRDMTCLYRDLLLSSKVHRLFDIGLIRTEVTPLELEGYGLVLRHETIPFASFVTEWGGSMLKDAALLTLRLNAALAELGLELKDAHPWNVLFDGCRPVFIDFSSIVPVRTPGRWRAGTEFKGKFVNPLMLMSAGLAKEARSLLVDERTLRGRNVSNWDVLRQYVVGRRWKQLLDFLASRSSWLYNLQDLANVVEEISIPLLKTRWSEYCDEEVDFRSRDKWMVKRRTAAEVLSRLRPATLLDIGSNTGWFSKLAAINGCRVIAFDVDEPSINKLYLNRTARELKILPLCMDFRKPTQAYGIGLRCESAVKRFQCDMVLGLAVVHHLVFSQREKFDSIVRAFDVYSRKWLLVEFIPKEDVHVAKMCRDGFEWYTLDNFVSELSKYFRKVEVLPSNPEPRVLLLCAK